MMKTMARQLGLALLTALGASAMTVATMDDATLTLDVSDRFRAEFVDWFDAGDATNARHDFVHNRLRVGVGLTTLHTETYLEYQQTVMGNVPAAGVGPGGVYRANTNRGTQVGNFLRQGWLRVHGSTGDYRLAARVGRQLYRDGREITPADPTLAWLRTARIGERLIGPFDYTAIGRSFDGATVTVDHETFNLTGFALRPTSGGFEVDGGRHISEIDLAGASYTLKDRPGFDRTNARLFWIYYADDRPDRDDALPLDNRLLSPAGLRRLPDQDELLIHTVGGEVLHASPLGPGRLDLLGWAAGQFGDWQDLEHRAWAFAVEAGYAMPEWWGTPWLRGGINRSSGDSDPGDGKHHTFHQMLPTARVYARTPFYNMMNNQDVFVQLLLRPVAQLGIRLDGHWLRATEGSDFAYFGGGATKDDFFGFGGVPAGGERDLAYLIDLGLTWTPCAWLEVQTYYGHAFGQRIIRAAFPDDDQLDYGFVEATVRF